MISIINVCFEIKIREGLIHSLYFRLLQQAIRLFINHPLLLKFNSIFKLQVSDFQSPNSPVPGIWFVLLCSLTGKGVIVIFSEQ